MTPTEVISSYSWLLWQEVEIGEGEARGPRRNPDPTQSSVQGLQLLCPNLCEPFWNEDLGWKSAKLQQGERVPPPMHLGVWIHIYPQ